MLAQISLMGNTVEIPRIEKVVRRKTYEKNGDVPEGCCVQCYMALEKKCVCKCGGIHHGEGAGLQKLDTFQEESKPEFSFYEHQVPSRCPNCGGRLGPIENYDHDGGWTVAGFEKRQWLYKTCEKCGTQWALWKLGVPRETEALP